VLDLLSQLPPLASQIDELRPDSGIVRMVRLPPALVCIGAIATAMLIPSSAAVIAGAVARARRGGRDVRNIWWPLERGRTLVTNPISSAPQKASPTRIASDSLARNHPHAITNPHFPVVRAPNRCPRDDRRFNCCRRVFDVIPQHLARPFPPFAVVEADLIGRNDFSCSSSTARGPSRSIVEEASEHP
jgi:hypothetical protein